ncbi:MAG: PDZ domain-containing protein, partial [Oscillochloris sp.]|nr:PDZ domain-containing protein [Oscillochloris sp.]
VVAEADVATADATAAVDAPAVVAEADVATANATADTAETSGDVVAVADAQAQIGGLEAIEEVFTSIYEQVNPSVVTILTRQAATPGGQMPGIPEIPGFPIPEAPQGQPGGGLGSGFVWDAEGHIVTNNHVIAGADEISVTFPDDVTLDAEVVGTDPASDLAVLRIDPEAHELIPIQVADSTEVQVGEVVAAIGNPFGEASTLTTGIISALGRSLPVGEGNTIGSGPIYTIPDVIQTDAAINPGNSGGVLLNDQGELIGVPTAIASPVRASAGIGFAVPSVIVQKVVPALIADGSYAHPWLGVSGLTLSRDLATAMDLERDQRGALVVSVADGSPAAEAGLAASNESTTIDGQEAPIGGDIIVAIEGEPVQSFDDLTTYLTRYTEVGETITLTVLRDGEEVELAVELAPRPGSSDAQTGQAGVTLGILGADLIPPIAQAMGLDADQQGVLIQQVMRDSPAAAAGLQGSSESVTIQGLPVLIGGDVITGFNGEAIANVAELQQALQQLDGDSATLTILRNGEEQTLEVDFGAAGES